MRYDGGGRSGCRCWRETAGKLVSRYVEETRAPSGVRPYAEAATVTEMALLLEDQTAALVAAAAGRCFHSSTIQLNLTA
jgi:hypothetical protein